MRKLTFLLGMLSALVLTACGKKGPVLYDKEGFKETLAVFSDSPIKDKDLEFAYFQSEKDLEENTLHFGKFFYTENGKIMQQNFTFPSKWEDATTVDDDKAPRDRFKFKDVDANKVIDTIKEGLEVFKDNNPDYESFNISTIFLESTGKAGEYKVGFKMEFRKIGEAGSTQRVGNKRITSTKYYKVVAEQKDGEWTFESEGE